MTGAIGAPDPLTSRRTTLTLGALVLGRVPGVMIGAPVFTVLGARMPRRALLLAVMALVVMANAGSSPAPDPPVLAITRLVAGLPHGA